MQLQSDGDFFVLFHLSEHVKKTDNFLTLSVTT